MNDYVLNIYKSGATLGAFKSAARDLNINTDEIAYKNQNPNNVMPWDFIDVNPGNKFLKDEYFRLLGEK